MNSKVIKLSTKEVIFAKIRKDPENNSNWLLEKPVTIGENNVFYDFAPYTNDNEISMHMIHVVSISTPTEQICEIYEKCVDQLSLMNKDIAVSETTLTTEEKKDNQERRKAFRKMLRDKVKDIHGNDPGFMEQYDALGRMLEGDNFVEEEEKQELDEEVEELFNNLKPNKKNYLN